MNKFRIVCVLLLALFGICGANAQGPAPAGAAAQGAGFDTLKGSWVRPDGGYTITIKGVGANGQLNAMYANPRPLPFAKAQSSREGATLRVFLELQAGGYNGSIYELTYDAASDQLKGIYHQAVAKQKFAVYFAHK